jgi:selenide,water dikinase
MGPEALAQVLRPLAGMFDPKLYPDLLQGLDTPDDAAVWRLDDQRALVLTADFFPPVVDDPYDFGTIAAANALSDLYAMGAQPLMGINLVAYPDDLDPAILSEILRGGADKLLEAGAVVAGGHTTSDKEPKYGLAVTGLVHPDRILTKAGAHPGDVLFLTTTAAKQQRVEPDHMKAVVASMARLNGGAARILELFADAVHAATDITGFGLAGHAHEMAQQSGLTLGFDWDRVPLLPGAADYARAGLIPGGGKRNQSYYGSWVSLRRALSDWEQVLLYDPQTSGGLFAAVAHERADEVERAFSEAGEPLWRVGQAIDARAGGLEIR